MWRFDGTLQKGNQPVSLQGDTALAPGRLSRERPAPGPRPRRPRAGPCTPGDHRHSGRLADRAELTAPRAAIVASGSELVRGDRFDRNGPYLASSLLRLGIEPARITARRRRGGRPRAALRDGLAYDLLCISGGLGPTHDDRTVELLARAAGVELHVDEELAGQIEALSRRVAERLRTPVHRLRRGRPQAGDAAGRGALVGLAGTAPAVVLEAGTCVVVALPGPAARAAGALAARARVRAAAAAAVAAPGRPSGASSGSTACPSRPWRRPSPAPAATGTGSR